ncbi:MAG: hypothetical protein HWD59_13330 [Coxiellaceae bacterium]|nr:MAG: hypothetical protein HWD59_13330 [Coxiellaceae bacterium]
MAKGDGMVPLYGDNNNSFFFNAQAKYGNDSNWGGAAGLGFDTSIMMHAS